MAFPWASALLCVYCELRLLHAGMLTCDKKMVLMGNNLSSKHMYESNEHVAFNIGL